MISAKVYGEDHQVILKIMGDLAKAYLKSGRFLDALNLSRKVWDSRRRGNSEDDPETILAMEFVSVSSGGAMYQRGN
jgi:hypothetical protein